MGSWTKEAVHKLINIRYVELRPCSLKSLGMGGNLRGVIARTARCNSILTVRSHNRGVNDRITTKTGHKYDSLAAVIKSLVKHPLTDKGIEQFLTDWKKTGQSI